MATIIAVKCFIVQALVVVITSKMKKENNDPGS
jgi:hypothetical protein